MERSVLYGAMAPFYDLLYSAKDYAGEARELLARARRSIGHTPRSLLDVACGTGRHLAEFRRAVPDLAGVDLAPAMLAVARRRLGPRVPLRRGDLRSFDLGRSFETVVCLFSAFGYLLTRADRDQALERLHAHVAPGGVALVEGWILPSRYRGHRISLLTYDGPEATIARVSETHRRGNRTTLRMRYLLGTARGGIRTFDEVHRNAIVEPAEILGSFRRAGFRARVVRTGRYRDRGLYIGLRPGGPAGPR